MTATKATVPLKNRRLAALLAWLVPGLGHFYQGRTGKGVLYAVCILGLYFVGMVLGDWQVVLWRWINPLRDAENFRFSYLCQFFVGLPALLALIQETLHYYDIPPILGGFMSVPLNLEQQDAFNSLSSKLAKLPEIGSVYTMMAGLLNILAIYDALEGPAQAEEDQCANGGGAVADLKAEKLDEGKS